jgi:hypothetical protein
MTKHTRLFIAVAVSVLVAGLGTGLIASYMGFQGLAVISGSGPDELAYVPVDAKLLGFTNVREVMNSELRQKFRELHPEAGSGDGLETQTGINIETDIDHVVVAIFGAGTNPRPLVLARGRFNETRIEGLIREKGGTAEDYKGKRLLVVAGGDGPGGMLTFAEPGLAIFGDAAAVKQAIDTHAGGDNVTDNPDLMGLVRDVDDANAWAVGRFDALTMDPRLPRNVLEQLPPINTFAASGHINGGVRATLRVEARDDAAAQDLREVVRGFIALARLQTGRNQQMTTLLNSVELAGDGTTVALSLTIPAGVLDLLAPAIGRPPEQALLAF